MSTLIACGVGLLLDFIFGDPPWLYHPIRLMGMLIKGLENCARKICKGDERKLLTAGVILWVAVVSISAGVPWILLYGARLLHPSLGFVLESFWYYQLLAAKGLGVESRKVYEEIERENLPGARKAVSMIVGRDTNSLTREGVIKAAVETVAENTSDGVTAPLLFMMLGGAPFGFFYKAVNTMDSMLGYKDEKYLYLGRASARLDDLLNFIPARACALFMMVAACVLGMDGVNAWKVYRRDRKNHASPNAAQTEAVCAGALRIQLAGDAWYFGKLYHKEFIGDDLRPVEAADILRAGRLLYGTAIVTFIVSGGMRLLFLL